LLKIKNLSNITSTPKKEVQLENTWVDFKTVKAAVTMQMVLDRYAVNWLRKKESELRGRCPIHKGDGADAFHVNVEKNAFQCFSCKARGNVLDFVAAMEQCSVRDAAVKLAEWFSVADGDQKSVTAPAQKPVAPPESGGEGTEAKNKPLTFQLRGVDPDHAYLQGRGIRKETAEKFGVGFFPGKGSMSGRVVIPIHNAAGELVAYAGRAIDGSEPKYKLPAGFHKSQVVYNLHLVTNQNTIIVVEGFFDCMKVHQAGYPCVALMGSSLSQRQEELLREYFSGVVLMLDGDEAGRRATDECLVRLGRKLWVKAIWLSDGQQPDQLEAETLRGLLGGR
jgi:DNA primase